LAGPESGFWRLLLRCQSKVAGRGAIRDDELSTVIRDLRHASPQPKA